MLPFTDPIGQARFTLSILCQILKLLNLNKPKLEEITARLEFCDIPTLHSRRDRVLKVIGLVTNGQLQFKSIERLVERAKDAKTTEAYEFYGFHFFDSPDVSLCRLHSYLQKIEEALANRHITFPLGKRTSTEAGFENPPPKDPADALLLYS